MTNQVLKWAYTWYCTILIPVSKKVKDKTYRVRIVKSVLNEPSNETCFPSSYVSKHQHLYLNLTGSFTRYPHQRKLDRFAANAIVLLLFTSTKITLACSYAVQSENRPHLVDRIYLFSVIIYKHKYCTNKSYVS